MNLFHDLTCIQTVLILFVLIIHSFGESKPFHFYTHVFKFNIGLGSGGGGGGGADIKSKECIFQDKEYYLRCLCEREKISVSETYSICYGVVGNISDFFQSCFVCCGVQGNSARHSVDCPLKELKMDIKTLLGLTHI